APLGSDKYRSNRSLKVVDLLDYHVKTTPAAKLTEWSRHIFISTAANGLFALMGYKTIRNTAAEIAQGKPIGVLVDKTPRGYLKFFFNNRLLPVFGIFASGYVLFNRLKQWNAPGNDRKWDDAVRILGDGMFMASSALLLFPRLRFLRGMILGTVALGVNWFGELGNDMVGK
ncbi:MAG: hypothetical protein HY692_05380, partial [Cyanobacteria bacterium NC_groundwater_1444_Ag_S-0.65um_54_12]|nr:hypothetical protein [Cyanobacteria bacterium NC_groundwater_1444_Ag_S-0.65um_54_12]